MGAAGAGLSLADELREADPGLTLHHVDSNDRIAVINIVYSGDGEEGEDESVNPAGQSACIGESLDKNNQNRLHLYSSTLPNCH